MSGQALACESFDITADGLAKLITVLAGTGVRLERIGVEGSAALGQPVVIALLAVGYDVREVQASRTNDRRGRRHRAKTDITDAQAIAAETLADPNLPPARKHQTTPPAAWQDLRILRSWRESLVLQRVRHLTEAEAVLTSLPISIRDQFPATSRVTRALNVLANLDSDQAALSRSGRLLLARLQAISEAITAINAQIKDIDAKIPALLEELAAP